MEKSVHLNSLVLQTDEDAWLAYPEARSFYDRLWLAQQLGYLCGPAGTNPPCSGWFFVKPVRNLLGLGIGAARHWYPKGTDFGVPPGSFWSQCFEGEHLSIDYRWNRRRGRWTPLRSVGGIFSGITPLCWIMQPRRRSLPQLPRLFDRIADTCGSSRINVEFIGGRVIECHLRSGLGDWRGSPATATRAVPIWKGMPVPQNMVRNEDDGAGLARLQRIGFVYQ